MDQVKDFLAVALKHGFWIGVSVVFLGTVGIWFMSVSSLDKERESKNSKIKTNANTITQYRGEMSDQPNDQSHARMKELITTREDEVLEAWQMVFDAQRDILTWPEVMQDEFLNEFKFVKDEDGKITDQLKLPFEKYQEHSPTGENEQLPPSLLRRYARYIGDTLPEYAEIAGTKWTVEFDKAGGGGPGGMGMGMAGMDMLGAAGAANSDRDEMTGDVEEPLVQWTTSSQEGVMKDLFPWRNQKDYPSELDVYYSQENLWILRQLLQIVAEVNGDAEQAIEAKVREIKKLSIGASVSFTEGEISEPGSRASAGFGGMGGMGMDMDDMMGGMDMDMGFELGGGSGTTESPDPGDGRYVNTAFEPINAADLRAAFSSEDPNQVAIAVAKRVPVMMHLLMDQREIPSLLAACGTAQLMVDVHQVRVMPSGGLGTTGGGGMGGDMMGDEMGMGMSMGMGMGGMGGGPVGGASTGDEEFPLDMEVEIYGLIYFYNPPNRDTLGVEKVGDGEVTIDESAEVIDALPEPNANPGNAPGTAPEGTNPAGAPGPDPSNPGTGGPAADPANPTVPGNPATPPAEGTNPSPPAAIATPATTP
ncbi:MAG: hypothetical protein AAFU85_08705 [Planctomycetota bacterium]